MDFLLASGGDAILGVWAVGDAGNFGPPNAASAPSGVFVNSGFRAEVARPIENDHPDDRQGAERDEENLGTVDHIRPPLWLASGSGRDTWRLSRMSRAAMPGAPSRAPIFLRDAANSDYE
jgi:hypothetical protein